MILTVNEIVKRFRTQGACVRLSTETVAHMAKVLGYGKRRVGGKVGYDQSLVTAIARHIGEALEYEEGLSRRPSKPKGGGSVLGDYFTYNGERDNRDYEFEVLCRDGVYRVDEGDIRMAVYESLRILSK